MSTTATAWIDIHVPNKSKLPLYGPLDIRDENIFFREEAVKFLSTFMTPFPYNLKVENFDILYQVGTGAFGMVVLVNYKLFGSYYAMKILRKRELVARQNVSKALNEKYMLQSVNCPFAIYLLYFSQDNTNIYFIVPFVYGGDLYNRLVKAVRFSENLTKFYAAQIVLAFQYLHKCRVVFRDLKLENVLLDHLGYIKIADFGLAKLVMRRTYTFCGTPDYMAPEVILSTGYGSAVDWWSLGVLIFEMASGTTPFLGANSLMKFNLILNVKYEMPLYFGDHLKDIVFNLLQRDVTRRLGNMKLGVDDIKNHPWFGGINWLAILNRRVVPPFVPPNCMRVSTNAFPELKEVNLQDLLSNDDYEDYFTEF